MSDITQILGAIEQGDRRAVEVLLPLVCAALRRLAMQKLVKEKPGQTLDGTGLVLEVYLRLVSPGASTPDQQPQFAGVHHFLGAAAEAMRRILTENARRKARTKHGGEWQGIDWIDP
jgi:hypothetical protein